MSMSNNSNAPFFYQYNSLRNADDWLELFKDFYMLRNDLAGDGLNEFEKRVLRLEQRMQTLVVSASDQVDESYQDGVNAGVADY